MKKVFILILLAVAGYMLYPHITGGGYIAGKLVDFSTPDTRVSQNFVGWLNDAPGYQAALDQRSETGEPIAVYFYTNWCGACKSFSKKTLSSGNVQDYFDGMLRVRINPDNGSTERDIADVFKIRGYPSLFIIPWDSEKKIKIESAKMWSPVTFINACDEAEYS